MQLKRTAATPEDNAVLMRRNVRREPLTDDRCLHENRSGQRCGVTTNEQPQMYKHLDSKHADCAPNCKGCLFLQEQAKRLSRLPTHFVEWSGQVPQTAVSPIPYTEIFSRKTSYETLSLKEQNKLHDILMQLAVIVYRSENPQPLMDFMKYHGIRPSTANPRSDVDYYSLYHSLQLSQGEQRITHKFLNPDVPYARIKRLHDEFLTRTDIETKPTRNPKRPIFTVPVRQVLAELMSEKELRHKEAGLSPPTEITIKFTIDAGSVFSGKGEDAHLTIGTLEDVDRGDREYRSRESCRIFVCHSGTLTRATHTKFFQARRAMTSGRAPNASKTYRDS